MRLESIQAELEALLEPRAERGFFERLWGIRQEPAEVEASALATLLKQLTPPPGGEVTPTRGPALASYFTAACRELEANLAVVRELTETRPHPPFAYVTWLWRVSQVLRTLERDGWLESPAWLPGPQVADPKPLSWLLRLPLQPLLPPLHTGRRLEGLALEPLLDLASRETQRLGRRRRLLEAARRVLLETAASVPQAAADVQARSIAITQQIREINRWQAGGLDPEVDLSHQLRSAVQRRDAAAVTWLLGPLDELTRGSPVALPLRARLSDARQSVRQRFARFAEPPSIERLSRDTFGETAARAVQRGAARAVAESDAAAGTEADLVRIGSAVDGSFELGRSVSPLRVLEEQRRMALVDFPTQSMRLAKARGVRDLPESLIGDPRLLLYDLASQTLLSRRYLAQRKRRRTTAPRYSEARYYLLDGSASMAGRRGRMRDAILIAELATMIRHLEHGSAAARPVVYYRYFSKGSEPLVTARSIDEASAAIEAVLLRKSRGETDIERALLDSFDELRQERERDDTLGRAQLVLVTDGVAKLNIERVWAARESVVDMPVQVSVIALGSENPALKQLAALQRARGQAVFYHYLSDETLYWMSRGVRAQPAAHAPSAGPAAPVETAPAAARPRKAVQPESVEPVDAALETKATCASDDVELWRELEQLVDELGVLQQPPDLERIQQTEHLDDAYAELGLSLDDVGLEAERARFEAQKRDARALSTRFDRWFPESSEPAPRTAPVSAELLGVIEVALLSVLDLVAYLDGAPLQRRVDAIEILERLLVEAGVSPWAYCRALPFVTGESRRAITELRGLVGRRDAA